MDLELPPEDPRPCASSERQKTLPELLCNAQYNATVRVEDTMEHKSGYTMYKIELHLQDTSNLLEGQGTLDFTFWRRYSEMHALYKHLQTAFKQLQLNRGGISFPPFPAPTVFGRHKHTVISDRKRGACRFLAFVLQHPILIETRYMLEFLAGVAESVVEAESLDELLKGAVGDILEPTTCPRQRDADEDGGSDKDLDLDAIIPEPPKDDPSDPVGEETIPNEKEVKNDDLVHEFDPLAPV